MTTKYYIKNNTQRHIIELKPGVGEFVFPIGEEVEIVDMMDVIDTPVKTKLPYVRFPAKQIAEAIINDFGRKDALELIVKESEG